MSGTGNRRGKAAGRRAALPGADELFRATGEEVAPGAAGGTGASLKVVDGMSRRPSGGRPASPASSGRQRHDEKITVYVSADELLRLERARLALRAEHGIAVDRGRIVREAIAHALADLEDRGAGSFVVRQLDER